MVADLRPFNFLKRLLEQRKRHHLFDKRRCQYQQLHTKSLEVFHHLVQSFLLFLINS